MSKQKRKQQYTSLKALTDLSIRLNPDSIAHVHCQREIPGGIVRNDKGEPHFDRNAISAHMAQCLTLQQNLQIQTMRYLREAVRG